MTLATCKSRADECTALRGNLGYKWHAHYGGAVVTAYRAEEQGIAAEDGGAWALVCEEHAAITQSDSLEVLKASTPDQWCDGCRGEDPRADFRAEAHGATFSGKLADDGTLLIRCVTHATDHALPDGGLYTFEDEVRNASAWCDGCEFPIEVSAERPSRWLGDGWLNWEMVSTPLAMFRTVSEAHAWVATIRSRSGHYGCLRYRIHNATGGEDLRLDGRCDGCRAEVGA